MPQELPPCSKDTFKKGLPCKETANGQDVASECTNDWEGYTCDRWKGVSGIKGETGGRCCGSPGYGDRSFCTDGITHVDRSNNRDSSGEEINRCP